MVTRAIAGETLLVPVKGRLADMRRIYSLDPVGAFVWERLDGVRTLGDVAGMVAEAFDNAPENAGEEVLAFAGELLAAGLVERKG